MDFWEFVWGTLVVFFFAMFLVVFVGTMIDVFASRDLNGWQKALWVLFMIALPVFGVLIYIIARGPKMAERRVDAAVAAGAAGGPAGEIAAAKKLVDSGAISNDEFEALKSKILV